MIGTVDDGVDIGGQARQVEASGHQAYTRGGAGIHREAEADADKAMASSGRRPFPAKAEGHTAFSHWRAVAEPQQCWGETVVAFAHLLAAAVAGEEELLQVIQPTERKSIRGNSAANWRSDGTSSTTPTCTADGRAVPRRAASSSSRSSASLRRTPRPRSPSET